MPDESQSLGERILGMNERSLVPFQESALIREIGPRDELNALIQEATQSVENDLALEDAGWLSLSSQTAEVVLPQQRIINLRKSRLYYTKDPLGRQSIRLWTDYTFGSGMTFRAEDKTTKTALSKYWDSPENRNVLSARGQRKSSDKLLVDGEVFFVQFLGTKGQVTIRWIDPLEITEIITDPDDVETVMYYERMWTDRQGGNHRTIYRSPTNIKNKPTKNAANQEVAATDEGIVSHLTYNTINQRGNPLLLPALDWMDYVRKVLASRIAVFLALAKFAWRTKVQGGQARVDAIKGVIDGQNPNAGSTLLENMGSDTTPIKTDSGARNAYQEVRLIKLQVFAAVGISEQYFGDISTGNLATAKTVELPMMKQFQSLQKVWADFYEQLDEVVLTHNGVDRKKWYVDRDFPLIAPRDVAEAADAIQKIVATFPSFGGSEDVKQVGLTMLGIDDVSKVLEDLEDVEGEPEGNQEAALIKVLAPLREVLKRIEVGNNGRKEQ